MDFAFGRIRVHPEPREQPVDAPARPPAADPADGGAGEAEPQGPLATPTLTLSGVDQYTDGANSHEVVNFVVKVPKGAKARKYCLVQWTKGFAREASGAYKQVIVYGKQQDWNDPEWIVDSTDPDPIYGSDATSRWNYNLPFPEAFTSSDAPGPAVSSDKGAVYAARFKVAVYETDLVPTTTTGTLSVQPLTPFQFWSYSVVVGQDGKFTHPQLP